jgi:hypothetical protein
MSQCQEYFLLTYFEHLGFGFDLNFGLRHLTFFITRANLKMHSAIAATESLASNIRILPPRPLLHYPCKRKEGEGRP